MSGLEYYFFTHVESWMNEYRADMKTCYRFSVLNVGDKALLLEAIFRGNWNHAAWSRHHRISPDVLPMRPVGSAAWAHDGTQRWSQAPGNADVMEARRFLEVWSGEWVASSCFTWGWYSTKRRQQHEDLWDPVKTPSHGLWSAATSEPRLKRGAMVCHSPGKAWREKRGGILTLSCLKPRLGNI
jgi:hypothetical protein